MTFLAEEAVVEVPALEPAGFGPRALARLVDWVFTFLVTAAAAVVLAMIAGLMEAVTDWPASPFIETLSKTTPIGWVGSTLSALSYYAVFEGIAGTTLGKRIVGMHVIGIDRTPVRFPQAVKRSLGFVVDALFFGAVGASHMSDSPEKQRVGDKWADTRVVWRTSLLPTELPTTGMTFLGGFTAVVVLTETMTLTNLVEYWLTT